MKNLFLAALVALAACGGSDLPRKPQISSDRAALGFGSDVGEAVFVGTTRTETLQVKNGGQDVLTLQAPKISGTNADLFTAVLDKTSVESGKKAFVQVTYKPGSVGKHSATMDLLSNAENAPTLTIKLAAEAAKP